MRESVERSSLPVLKWLSGLPRPVPFLGVLVLLVLPIFLPATWPLMALGLLIMAWLAYVSWPQLTGAERLLRVAVLLFFLAVLATRVFPR